MKTLLSALALLASLALAQAQTTYTVHLDAAQDGGGGRTGSGDGTLTLNAAGNALTFNNILWSGLSANSTLAHIHGPAAPGVPAGVLYTLFPTYTTVGGTSGAINGTMPLVAGTGTFSLSQQLDQLNSGLWYINIHSTAFGGGEIRGQIVPVPEPSTWMIGSVGLVGLLLGMRRRSA
jgi:hypothetical protein